MIDVTHCCNGIPGLETPAIVAHTEYEASFLLPQLMGALAGESSATSIARSCPTRPDKALRLKGRVGFLRALMLRFSPL